MSVPADRRARSRRLVEIGLWVGFLFISTTINASSVLMEYSRDGRPIGAWEPFVWEYSSAVFTLLLIPLVLDVESRFPLTHQTWRWSLPLHLAATLPFSIIHVAGMVSLRKLIYAATGRTYDFGHLPSELLYEWRKDAWSYFIILFIVNAYRIYRERSEGEANYVNLEAPDPVAEGPHFRVTYNQRDFNLPPSAVEWIESAGNYVVLYSGDRTYLMRDTMKNLEVRLAGTSFQRVHRSKMVNLDHAADVRRRGAQMQLVLDTGTIIDVSRSHHAAVSHHSSLRPSKPR